MVFALKAYAHSLQSHPRDYSRIILQYEAAHL